MCQIMCDSTRGFNLCDCSEVHVPGKRSGYDNDDLTGRVYKSYELQPFIPPASSEENIKELSDPHQENQDYGRDNELYNHSKETLYKPLDDTKLPYLGSFLDQLLFKESNDNSS